MGGVDRRGDGGARGAARALALLGGLGSVAWLTTSLLRARRELDDLRVEAEELRSTLRRRRQAMATAVHELRTPLATVRGFLETLAARGGELDETTRDRVMEIALRNAVLLGQRISTMLEFERLTGNGVVVEPHPVALHDLLPRLVEDSAGILQRHDVHTDVDGELWVLGDEDALAHILGNLLGNAVKHSPAGSRIEVRAAPHSDGVELTVVDHGAGIAAEDLPHIFTPFYRAPRQDAGGAGIGLAVVARYAELQGARIDVDSTLGEGTTVTLVLRASSPGIPLIPRRCGEVYPARPTGP